MNAAPSLLSLRVLTVNTHKGFAFLGRRFVLSELREAVREVGADLVFLQEVQGEHAGNGPFTGDPDVATNGTLTFDQAISGWFVIGLKAANNYSYYLFNATSPITSLTYDSTAGVALNRNDIPQALSHANLYAVAQPVPEPETYALMMAGLAAVGFLSRRRKTGSRK